ncbi:tyrosinase family protein [Bradyrhizobium sp. HKCCYLS3077]|uniref:tyrosinase family protein n=1 Tax=Bradyrhizobium sp. HKCCYLS3077 TaxID=3420761 RepID=UPI003EBCCD2E
MHVDVSIASSDTDGRVFLTWTPIQCSARLIDGPGAGKTVKALLRNGGNVGQVKFDVKRSHRGTPTLQLDMPGDGSPIKFWVAGEFKKPSANFGDAVLEVVDANTSAPLSSKQLMVRVRKNAQSLSDAERDRFLAAFATLNGQGTGRYTQFRDMHVDVTLGESHNNWGFLPWHRSYLLDLERELQAIDATVSLPYWRFDQPAEKVLSLAFMGVPDSHDRVQFTAGHPFRQWKAEDEPGIIRGRGFPPASKPPGLKTEDQTIALGEGNFAVFGKPFVGAPDAGMELDPHGYAHTSFGPASRIYYPRFAPRDPMFFLLHANVDRLWAKWQWFYKRTSDVDAKAFYNGPPVQLGHNLGDTMWPWNGVTGGTRPDTAPGGALAPSALTSAPGPRPKVSSMLDYQAVNGGVHLGFDYDDVPFEMPDGLV